jgi:hypothetical protein
MKLFKLMMPHRAHIVLACLALGCGSDVPGEHGEQGERETVDEIEAPISGWIASNTS